MSGTLPVDPGLSGLTISSNFSVIKNQTIGGIVTTTRLPGHYWSFTCNYPNLDRGEAGSLYAFLNKQQGYDTFQFTPTKYKDAFGSATERKTTLTGVIDTTITVPVNALQGTTTNIGFTSNFTNVYYQFGTHGYFFRAGDFIKFSDHNKVYQITNDVALDSTGNGTIDISPPLQKTLSSANIQYTDVPWTVITGEITNVMEAGLGDVHSMAFDLREKP